MRRSEPTARRTWSTSAPNNSQTLAISFMNEILRGQHRVGGVLAKLRARAVHHHDRRARARERRVELSHDVAALLVLGANHHAVRLEEVVNRRTLLQELGVAHHAERMGRLPADDLADTLGRTDRHGALVDDDLVPVHRLGDLARHAQNVLQVGRAVLALRRADGDEDHRRGAGPPSAS